MAWRSDAKREAVGDRVTESFGLCGLRHRVKVREGGRIEAM